MKHRKYITFDEMIQILEISEDELNELVNSPGFPIEKDPYGHISIPKYAFFNHLAKCAVPSVLASNKNK
ncbi:MAG: hypothetical protein K5656_03520 [Lachnospiraceae bacterium]|nr:hypothetical protein [Lachnospiraceae bacterium]